MRVKVYENIYNYELVRYNKTIKALNKEYNSTIEKLKLNEKNRINFIKSISHLIKNYIDEYIKSINDFSFVVDNYTSQSVCSKDELYWNEELSKFKADIMTVYLMKNSYHLMIIWKLIIQKQEKMSYLIMK